MKNYVVIVKNIKWNEVNNMINYLLDTNHKNHINTTNIIEVDNVDRRNFIKMINGNKIINNQNTVKTGPKMKLSNKSITFDIPKDYDINQNQLIELTKLIESDLIELYKLNGVEIKQEDLFSVIHNQNNPHIHSIIPTLNKNGKTLRFLKNRKFLIDLKNIFTKNLDNILETNINDYKTQSEANEELEKINNYSLEDIQKLKIKYKNQKKLKRVYDYIYRIKKIQLELNEKSKINEIETKQLKNMRLLEGTIKKIQEDGIITSNEEDLLFQVLEGIGLDRTMLNKSIKKTILKSRKKR